MVNCTASRSHRTISPTLKGKSIPVLPEPSRGLSFLSGAVVALLVGAIVFAVPALAAETQAGGDTKANVTQPDVELPSAPVEIDGTVLFLVRGSSAYPAEERAEAIVGRIKALADDQSVPADAVDTVEVEGGTKIFAGSQRLMVLSDADAQLESIDRKTLAAHIAKNIREAVTEYREARSRKAVERSAVLTAGATAILVAFLALILWLVRWLHVVMERRYRQRIHSIGIQSFQIVRTERIWDAMWRVLASARVIAILILAFIYLHYVLRLFPWTRGIANRQLAYVLDPLRTMGRGIVNEIPGLIFLVILFFVTRYLLKLIYLFFGAVGRGEITLGGFDREWANPTYKLLRGGIIAFALVVAYPYVPGSDSAALKGITVFIGIVFSLSSTSALANIIAGYSLTYRRAFKVGDRVKIGDTIGDVTQIHLQATHLKTVKNEEVTVPNSAILNNEVTNYSALARKEGLILHTRVGVGYETPWRQVEAMLLLAAERTPGLMKEPSPFIRQNGLEVFAVTYELNVYCNNAQAAPMVYTDLHRNILDVFNEYRVQIMTPAYEGDPEERKIVPKEQWFKAPAKREHGAA